MKPSKAKKVVLGLSENTTLHRGCYHSKHLVMYTWEIVEGANLKKFGTKIRAAAVAAHNSMGT